MSPILFILYNPQCTLFLRAIEIRVNCRYPVCSLSAIDEHVSSSDSGQFQSLFLSADSENSTDFFRFHSFRYSHFFPLHFLSHRTVTALKTMPVIYTIIVRLSKSILTLIFNNTKVLSYSVFYFISSFLIFSSSVLNKMSDINVVYCTCPFVRSDFQTLVSLVSSWVCTFNAKRFSMLTGNLIDIIFGLRVIASKSFREKRLLEH